MSWQRASMSASSQAGGRPTLRAVLCTRGTEPVIEAAAQTGICFLRPSRTEGTFPANDNSIVGSTFARCGVRGLYEGLPASWCSR